MLTGHQRHRSRSDHAGRSRWTPVLAGLAALVVLLMVAPLAADEPTDTAAQDVPDGDTTTTPTSEQASDLAQDRLSTASADTMLMFADVPMVVSASRTAQPITMSSAPVSILTAADLHYGGFTNVAEALLFVPGMDVLRMDRNHYAIGVRGLHDAIAADRTLVLVNGRVAGNPLTGVADFLRLPLFMEDIERIEVVRGPGSAAWGANAFNGVINVITKDPKDTLGVLLGSTVDQFGDTYSHVRWGHEDGPWAWRISTGYESHASSEDAIDSDFTSHDWARNYRFDGQADYQDADATKISFGLGVSHLERGVTTIMGFGPSGQNRLQAARLFARIDHTFDDGASGYVQWFGNFDRTRELQLCEYWASENDLEAQLNFDPIKDHNVTVGGNVRWTHIDTKVRDPQAIQFPDEPFDEYSGGLFAIDRWQATRRLTIEGQLRGDYYSGTGPDWSGRMSALYALDSRHRHVLRASAAKAFRAPLIDLRESEVHRLLLPSPPFPPDTYWLNAYGTPDLDNEQTWSVELGYSGAVTDSLTWRVDGYHQWYTDLVGAATVVSGPPDTVIFGNNAEARAWGAETELAIDVESCRLSLWYAYNDVTVDWNGHDIRSLLPAAHKVGLTGRFFLPDDWAFNANWRYTSTTPGDAFWTADTPESYRLDLTLAKKLSDVNGEVMVGVTDVLDEGATPSVGYSGSPGHDTPGRTVFARVQFEF